MKLVRFYPFAFLIFLLAGVGFNSYVLAAESEPESITTSDSTEESTVSQNEEELENDTDAQAESILESDDNFIPSVQISEDLSVSFPVNI